MKSYDVWTYDQVRAQIIEAADTLMMGEPDRGPGYAGMVGEVVRDAADAYGYGTFSFRRIPSPGALTRMEEAWAWINTYLDEPDRKLIYEYGYLKTRKGLTIRRWCEKNGWEERMFERAVRRCCQQIADELNRKHAIRLTMAVDGVSGNQSEERSSEVASDNRAPARRLPYHRADDAKPVHTEGSEDAIAHHIEKVNQRRREEADRQRKAALRRAEDAAKLAAKCAERQAKRKQAA